MFIHVFETVQMGTPAFELTKYYFAAIFDEIFSNMQTGDYVLETSKNKLVALHEYTSLSNTL